MERRGFIAGTAGALVGAASTRSTSAADDAATLRLAMPHSVKLASAADLAVATGICHGLFRVAVGCRLISIDSSPQYVQPGSRVATRSDHGGPRIQPAPFCSPATAPVLYVALNRRVSGGIPMNIATILALCLILAAGAYPASGGAAPSQTDSKNVAQVWQREAEYWRCVKAGDVDGYVSLWHDKFIGWPCGQEHPKRKASIGDWVREVRDKHITVSSDLTREGAEDFGDVVVVHYRFTRVDTYPDGRVEGTGKVSKITHTWMKQGDTWLIIGGMCGTLPDSAE